MYLLLKWPIYNITFELSRPHRLHGFENAPLHSQKRSVYARRFQYTVLSMSRYSGYVAYCPMNDLASCRCCISAQDVSWYELASVPSTLANL